MFKMSTYNVDAHRESFVKAENRFADCFIGQIIPDSLHSCFQIYCALWFTVLFELTKNYLLIFCFACKQNIMS